MGVSREMVQFSGWWKYPFSYSKLLSQQPDSCSFSPQIPSTQPKTEEIAAHLQDFLGPDRAYRKKLQNCSFGRSRRTAGTSPRFRRRGMFT